MRSRAASRGEVTCSAHVAKSRGEVTCRCTPQPCPPRHSAPPSLPAPLPPTQTRPPKSFTQTS
eukprot:1917582-Rhodomonas_salina.1